MTDTASHDFPVQQEEDDVASRRAVHVAVASVVIGAIAVLLSALLRIWILGSLQPSAAGPEGVRPAPRELSHIEQTPIWNARVGIDLRERQRRELESWGWVDRRAGIAKIPIDRAIDIVAAEGSP